MLHHRTFDVRSDFRGQNLFNTAHIIKNVHIKYVRYKKYKNSLQLYKTDPGVKSRSERSKKALRINTTRYTAGKALYIHNTLRHKTLATR